MPETVVKDGSVDGMGGVERSGLEGKELDGKGWKGLERVGRSGRGAGMMSERRKWT